MSPSLPWPEMTLASLASGVILVSACSPLPLEALPGMVQKKIVDIGLSGAQYAAAARWSEAQEPSTRPLGYGFQVLLFFLSSILFP